MRQGEQHVTKKLIWLVFNKNVQPKGEQPSINEQIVLAENYLDRRFEIVSRAKKLLTCLSSKAFFIITREPKMCKQRDFYKLKLLKI